MGLEQNIIPAVFVLLKCIFLHLLADLFCSKGSGGETTFSATCSTRSLLSTQLSAIQQEADWLQDAEIIQNHLKERMGKFFPMENLSHSAALQAQSEPKGGDSVHKNR